MRLRTISEAADALGVQKTKLRRGVQEGRYPSLEWSGRVLVDIDVLDKILESEKACAADTMITKCAAEIGVSASTLRRMVHAGVVPYEQHGKYYYFNVPAVKDALRRRMNGDK